MGLIYWTAFAVVVLAAAHAKTRKKKTTMDSQTGKPEVPTTPTTSTPPVPRTSGVTGNDASPTPTLNITEYALGDGLTEIEIGEDHIVLDVHMIDGAYCLRVLEDYDSDVTTIRVLPAALGHKLPGSVEDYTPIPTRSGGAHFFLI